MARSWLVHGADRGYASDGDHQRAQRGRVSPREGRRRSHREARAYVTRVSTIIFRRPVTEGPPPTPFLRRCRRSVLTRSTRKGVQSIHVACNRTGSSPRGTRSSLPSGRRKPKLLSGSGLPSSSSSSSLHFHSNSTSNSRHSEDGLGLGAADAAEEYSHEYEENEGKQPRQQVSVHQVLAERLNPRPDFTLDSDTLSEALHDSNKHLTDKDREFLYHVRRIYTVHLNRNIHSTRLYD